jgi:hypothetical protein
MSVFLLSLGLPKTAFIVIGIRRGILFVKKVSESHDRIAVYILTRVSTGLLSL